MRCPRCQHENPTGMKFCGQCAGPLASCPSCGATNPPENKFCGQCATALAVSCPACDATDRERLIALYGAERGKKIQYAEAFELNQYGRQASVDELKQMFPGIQ